VEDSYFSGMGPHQNIVTLRDNAPFAVAPVARRGRRGFFMSPAIVRGESDPREGTAPRCRPLPSLAIRLPADVSPEILEALVERSAMWSPITLHNPVQLDVVVE
jgi:hypothetical protein